MADISRLIEDSVSFLDSMTMWTNKILGAPGQFSSVHQSIEDTKCLVDEAKAVIDRQKEVFDAKFKEGEQNLEIAKHLIRLLEKSQTKQ